MERYRGSCHCGEIQFEFKAEQLRKACVCNCSICRRKQAVMSLEYVPENRFKLLKESASLQRYIFGDHCVNHCFCRICGIHTFHEAVARPGQFRINLACVSGVDLTSLELVHIDGASY